VLHGLAEPLKSEVIHAFVLSLRFVWLVTIPFSAVGLFANFFCKEIPMHKHVDEKWGLNAQAPPVKDQELGQLPPSILKYNDNSFASTSGQSATTLGVAY
jgi:hypothetical protein